MKIRKCYFILFVWSRNGANWTKASWRQNSILWEEQLADPTVAYKTFVNVMNSSV